MAAEEYIGSPNNSSMKNFEIQLTDPMLYDRLHTLSAEYSISVEMLVGIAVKRLIDEVGFVRDLRAGRIDLEQPAYFPSFSK